jgi:predicted RecA/RadA family phage recombinase
MKILVQPGTTVTLTAPYTVASGGGFQVGKIFAVANAAALVGVPVEGDVEGVFDLTKATGAGTAPVEGGDVYWDNATKLTTAVVATNLKIGAALLGANGVAPAIGDTTMRVRLNGTTG